jgi:hypothetical protein
LAPFLTIKPSKATGVPKFGARSQNAAVRAKTDRIAKNARKREAETMTLYSL